MSHNGLTPQQQRFVEEYILDPVSQTKAALRAGYSGEHVSTTASRLMKHPLVKEAIEEHQKEAAGKLGITQQRILQELSALAFSNLQDVMATNDDGTTTVNISSLPRSVASALQELSITEKGGKVKSRTAKATLANKLAALQLIGKHLGMFTEKVEHTGTLTLEQLVQASLDDKEDKEETPE